MLLGGTLLRDRHPPESAAARWRVSPWFSHHAKLGDFAPRAIGSAYGLLTCSGWDCETDCTPKCCPNPGLADDGHRDCCSHADVPTVYTWNGQTHAIDAATAAGYRDLIDGSVSELMQRPLLLNPNILLENAWANRLLVWGNPDPVLEPQE